MSKRAEERAKEFEDTLDYYQSMSMWPEDAFRKGYEQAEKDMKERFIQFVHRHYPINYTGWIQDFQRAMEDEK